MFQKQRVKVIVDGKRLTSTQLEGIILNAIDNIIMSGFNSVEELERLTQINSRYNNYITDVVLFRLESTYNDHIVRECDKSLSSVVSSANVALLTEKLILILELIEKRRKTYISLIADNAEDYITLEDEEYDDEDTKKNISNLSNLVVRDNRAI